jgi:hypothetical protein
VGCAQARSDRLASALYPSHSLQAKAAIDYQLRHRVLPLESQEKIETVVFDSEVFLGRAEAIQTPSPDNLRSLCGF